MRLGTASNDLISADLHSDGHWIVTVASTNDPVLSVIFASQYGGPIGSPADGQPGALALSRAAADMDGTFTMDRATFPDSDTSD